MPAPIIGQFLLNATLMLLTEAFVANAKKSGKKVGEAASLAARAAHRTAMTNLPLPGDGLSDEVSGFKQAREEREHIMSYDIFGGLYDDDDVGAIGGESFEDFLVGGLSNSEIVGADFDLIGEDAPSAKKAMLKKLLAQNAAAVVKTGLDKRRRYPLGFVPTDLASGATQAIPSSPQNLYRAERLVIPSDIAFDLGITDIKVGNQSQFVQNVEVPAAIFSEVAIDTAVHFDTAEVGNQVSVQARNKSGAVVQFTAALIGTTAK